jgi:hypothetical protein
MSMPYLLSKPSSLGILGQHVIVGGIRLRHTQDIELRGSLSDNDHVAFPGLLGERMRAADKGDQAVAKFLADLLKHAFSFRLADNYRARFGISFSPEIASGKRTNRFSSERGEV